MKTYLVGGAIRDELLGLPIKDRDWVVVGTTPEMMLARGYQQVGRDFPVFLHPVTHEEYALARTERKTGPGYTGFETGFSPEVTLEQDLMRRDLTINAIARDTTGHYIDPYQGQLDIKNRVLRHISDAFVEDPLRVLRVARFAANYNRFHFRIADNTITLMRLIVSSGELTYLSPERVWKETEKALGTSDPEVYFQVLHICGALGVLFPELNRLFDFCSKEPHSSSEVECLRILSRTSQLTNDIAVRFAALLQSVEERDSLCLRLRVPSHVRKLTSLVAELSPKLQRLEEQTAEKIIAVFDRLDAWRKPERVDYLILIDEANAHGASEIKASSCAKKMRLSTAFQVANAVDVASIIKAGFKGPTIRQELTRRRISALKKLNFFS